MSSEKNANPNEKKELAPDEPSEDQLWAQFDEKLEQVLRDPSIPLNLKLIMTGGEEDISEYLE